MTTIMFLVRHAVHDRVGRVLCGRMADVGLSAEGRAQAQRLARRLSGERIASVQTGPLERARRTAEPIAEVLGLQVEVAEAIDEIDFGEWTGRSFDELESDPRWTVWNTARSVNRPPRGESMLEAQARAVAHLERLRDAYPNERVLLVSHSDVIKAILLHCLGLTVEAHLRVEVDPASISIIAMGDWGARVLSMNEAVAS